MREILFRGKRKDGGSLHGEKWATGSHFYDQINNKHLILGNFGGHCEVDPATVGQYTGLTDKHGTKIYEGDIVEVWIREYAGREIHFRGVITFEFQGWIVDDMNNDENKRLRVSLGICDEDDRDEIIVLGSIHTTPGLIRDVEGRLQG